VKGCWKHSRHFRLIEMWCVAASVMVWWHI